jgi:hypothetical protein
LIIGFVFDADHARPYIARQGGNFCWLTLFAPMSDAAQQLVNLSAPRGKTATQCEHQFVLRCDH